MVNWYNEVVAHKNELLADIERLLKIPSVRNDSLATHECPVGPGPKEALDEMLLMADEAGFLFESFGNLVGHIEWGNGGDLFGILGHVDVVPTGKGWISDPFIPTYRDGKLYARGVLDDKGPLIAAFFAMKLLKQKGFYPKKKIRLIVGTDEESDWKCLKEYQKFNDIPQIGFVPDAYFPIVNGEKGTLSLRLNISDSQLDTEGYLLENFKSGVRENMVPEEAEAVISGKNISEMCSSFNSFIQENNLLNGTASIMTNKLYLSLKGKAAHGSKPDSGVNAATYLAKFLSRYSFTSNESQSFIDILGSQLHLDYYGKSLGILFSDNQMGNLTINPGVIHYELKKGGTVEIDIRYPKGITSAFIEKTVKEKLIEKVNRIDVYPKLAPHYVSNNSTLVKKLLKIYSETTGLPSYEQVIGGATYARLMPNGVAFGALFPNAKDTMHQPNECMEIDHLILACSMYARALEELVC